MQVLRYLVCQSPSAKTIENELDRTRFAITAHVITYFKKVVIGKILHFQNFSQTSLINYVSAYYLANMDRVGLFFYPLPHNRSYEKYTFI